MIVAINNKTYATIARYKDDEVKAAVVDIRAKGYSITGSEALKDGNIVMWVHKRGE